MISQFAHEYVHSNSVGNYTVCKEIIQETKESLETLYENKNIMGYSLLMIKSKLDVEEQLLDGKFEKITKGQFPFVYSFIQPAQHEEIDFDKLMEELLYTRLDI